MTYPEVLMQRIQTICKERGISYNKLASMSGVRQSTIDNIVRGVSKNPKIITVHKIAYAFGMTLSEFLDYEPINEVSFEDDNCDES